MPTSAPAGEPSMVTRKPDETATTAPRRLAEPMLPAAAAARMCRGVFGRRAARCRARLVLTVTHNLSIAPTRSAVGFGWEFTRPLWHRSQCSSDFTPSTLFPVPTLGPPPLPASNCGSRAAAGFGVRPWAPGEEGSSGATRRYLTSCPAVTPTERRAAHSPDLAHIHPIWRTCAASAAPRDGSRDDEKVPRDVVGQGNNLGRARHPDGDVTVPAHGHPGLGD